MIYIFINPFKLSCTLDMGGVILEKATPIRKEMPLSDKYDRSEELQSGLASLSKSGMKINKCPQRIKRVNSCLFFVFFPLICHTSLRLNSFSKSCTAGDRRLSVTFLFLCKLYIIRLGFS